MIETETTSKVNTRHIPLYKVIIHNDPITTFDFVIGILIKFFRKNLHDAKLLAQEVHETGMGLAGIYPLEHAEHLVDQAKSLARANKYPLAFTIEPD